MQISRSWERTAGPAAARPELRQVWRGVLAGCGLAGLLVVLIVIRYPGPLQRGLSAWELGLGAGLGFATLGAGLVWLGRRVWPAAAIKACALGSCAGLLGGLLWMLEISFNNFAPAAISMGPARFWVDNGIWATVALLIAGASIAGAAQARRFAVGLQVGLWSGLVSGLLACLMGLLVVTAGMDALLADPYNVQEWAAGGAQSGAASMATYFAYETLAGAVLHLVVLGLGMGGLLGLLGSALGASLARLRSAS